MSLPLLVSAARVSTAQSSKFKGNHPIEQKTVEVARSSLDTVSLIGIKRKPSMLDNADTGNVAPINVKLELDLDPLPKAKHDAPKRIKVAIIGVSDLGRELAECLAGRPGLVLCSVAPVDDTQDTTLFDVMPGVTVHNGLVEACAASDFLIFTSNYIDTQDVLSRAAIKKHLKGKVAMQLASGTPQEACLAHDILRSAGGQYLDACMLSQDGRLGLPGASMMVSGDKDAWNKVEPCVRVIAPASFYGGVNVAWANAVNTALCVFLMSVHLGMQQASAITSSLGVPRHVLPTLLAGSFMPVVRGIIRRHRPAPATSTLSTARTGALSPVMSVESSVPPSQSGAVQAKAADMGAPDFGSSQWVAQLQRIRDVCRESGTDHSIIDGWLSAAHVQGTGGSMSGLAKGMNRLGLAHPSRACSAALPAAPVVAAAAPAPAAELTTPAPAESGNRDAGSLGDDLLDVPRDWGFESSPWDDLAMAWAP